jgi:hypothetical protein
MDPLATGAMIRWQQPTMDRVRIPSPVPGCMDPLATNMIRWRQPTMDRARLYTPPVPGCMDPLAANYDPLAAIDNGSCT